MKRSDKAFSLVEAIVGVTIIGIMAVFSVMGLSTIFKADISETDNTLAVHLIQKSQEEIRQVAQNNFDDLPGCDFVSGNACGLSHILPAEFNRLTRLVNITPQGGSTELHRVEIEVQWTDERGVAHSIPSVMFISRPPNPLPGNLVGLVTDSSDPSNNPLGGVLIQISKGGLTHSLLTSAGVLAHPTKIINYDFKQGMGGTYGLAVGSWNLLATRNGYQPHTETNIIISSNAEQEISFSMDPNPADGIIIAKLQDPMIGGGTPTFNDSSSRIYIYDDGGSLPGGVSGAYDEELTYTVEFSDSDPRSFTVFTNEAWQSNLCGYFSCGGYKLMENGWSSSTSVDCGNPWYGNSGTDAVTVNPGQTVNVDIPLGPVPSCEVEGFVRDTYGNPVVGQRVRGYWHNWNFYRDTFTEDDGHFTTYLPCEQDMFPNTTSRYAILRAYGLRQVLRCCDTDSWETVYANRRVGPLNSGAGTTNVGVITLNLDPRTYNCGNATGVVYNIETSGGIDSARMYLRGYSRLTDASGGYIFDCGAPAPPFCLQERWYYYRVRHGSYYPYNNSGSPWYADRSDVYIMRDTTNMVPDVGMLKICHEPLTVNVTDISTGNPVANADLTLNTFNESGSSVERHGTTNSSGSYTFNNVQESWPTPFADGHSAFKQTTRRHSLRIEASTMYDPVTVSSIELECGKPKTINQALTPLDLM